MMLSRSDLIKLRELLDVGEQNKTHNAVFTIITALRGPDNAYDDDPNILLIKEATTVLIRAKVAGPRSAIATLYSNPVFEGDRQELVNIRIKLEEEREFRNLVGGHFQVHAYNAFYALGLKWNEINPIEFFE